MDIILRRRRRRGTVFLLRDDFVTAESAPLTDPRQAEPGPGEWDVTDPDNVLSISGGDLVDAGTSTSTHGLVGDAIIRQAGLYMACRVLKLDTNNYPFFGFNNSDDVTITTTDSPSLAYITDGWRVGYLSTQQFLFGANDTSEAVVVIGADVNYYFARLQGDAWQLIWVDSRTVATPLYHTYRLSNSQTETDKISVGILPAPFTRPDAFERFRVDGSVSAGYTNDTADADFILTFTLDSLPSSGELDLEVRRSAGGDFWQINFLPDGRFRLLENNGATVRASTSTGAVSGGEAITIILRGNTISAYYDNTQAWEYTDATELLRETGFEVASLGTGGAISDLRVYRAYLRNDSGLGENLLTNGDFSAWTGDDPDGWNVTEDANNFVTRDGTNDRVRIVAAPDGVLNPSLSQSVLTEGNYYQITINIESITTGVLRFRTGSFNFNTFSTAGVYSFYILALTSAPIALDTQNSISELDATINSVSVKQVEFTDTPAGTQLTKALS